VSIHPSKHAPQKMLNTAPNATKVLNF